VVASGGKHSNRSTVAYIASDNRFGVSFREALAREALALVNWNALVCAPNAEQREGNDVCKNRKKHDLCLIPAVAQSA